MLITKEMFEDMYLPSKKQQVDKVIHWVEHGLVDVKGILQCCLDLMSPEDVDNLVALVEPEIEEDEDIVDDLYIAAKLEEAFEEFDRIHPNKSVPQQAEPIVHTTFNGFIF